MTEVSFTARGMSRVRLTTSLLTEAVFSVRILKASPARYPLHRPWTMKVRERLRLLNADLSLLSDLVSADGLVPNFLAPPPEVPSTGISAELDGLREVPVEVVRDELNRRAIPRTARVCDLYADPQSALAALAETIRAYWEVAIAPYWQQVRSSLDSDIAYRARRLTTGGVQALFSDLHPEVVWDEGTVRWSYPIPPRAGTENDGLSLLPSLFAPRPANTHAPHWRATMCYPARGIAALWEETRQANPPAALAKVLGRTRALLLAELAEPATTTDLAHRTGLTTGGVSQHLTALRDTGLITGHRDGLHVIYTRTAVADSLLLGPQP